MSFKFGSTPLPTSIRGARTLVWTMAAIIMLVAATSIIFGFFFGPSGTITYGPIQASGSGPIVWGIVFGAISVGFIVLGLRLASLSTMDRNLVVAAEVAVAAFVLFTSKSISDGLVVTLIAVATIALLFVPSAQAAFAGGRTDSGTPPPSDAEKSGTTSAN